MTAFSRLLRDERFIKTALQFVFLVVVVASVIALVQSAGSALAANNLSPTFSFLNSRASFGIGGAEAYYSPNDSYLRAFMVGLENTVRVVILGLPLTTILGIFFGVCLLSSNFLVKNIARVYVEVLRNTPLLVQLFAFYYIVVLALPAIRNAIEIPAGNPLVALSNRGIVFMEVLFTPRAFIFGIFAAIGLVLGYTAWRELKEMRERTGKNTHRTLVAGAIILIACIIGYVVASASPTPTSVFVDQNGEMVEMTVADALEQDLLTDQQRAEVAGEPFVIIHPQRQGLRYVTGSLYSSEYIALLLGLVIYTSAFVAEIVRAGIQAVDKGQVEASRALGLGYGKTLTMIVLPQALRVIIPPMGNQYLNLAKNSSLAIAISYTDVFQVSNTIINQSGQTVSVFAMLIAFYLVMSLLISYVMNTVNSRFQLVTRTNASRSLFAQIFGLFRRAPARR